MRAGCFALAACGLSSRAEALRWKPCLTKLQVYVDGFYVGLAEDFGQRGRALDLAAGSHRVELRAPDYDMLWFSVMVEPNQIVPGAGRKFSSPLRPLCPLW